jgi:hypothetical protein
MRSMIQAIGFSMLILVIVAASQSPAQEYKRLAEFVVETIDGRPIKAFELSSEDQWILVYVTPNCPNCQALLTQLNSTATPRLIQRTVIIVGDNLDEAKTLARSYPALSMPWYADTSKEARNHLKIGDPPMIVGAKKTGFPGLVREDWRYSGIPSGSAAALESIKKWVDQ